MSGRIFGRIAWKTWAWPQPTPHESEVTPIQGIDRTRFDRAHFAAFGDSALHFEVVYYVLDPDYNLSMDIQQQINLALFRQLDERGVNFAFPSRRLYVEGTGVPLRTQVQLLDVGRVERSGGAAGDRSGTARVQQFEEGQTHTT